jgi:UDP-GlcNAc:undecaprenyl-phosphate GlcNAc-1-phosphate transferase
MSYFLLTLLILNSIIIFFFDKISFLLNLFDHPDLSRKIHLKPISAIGGFIVFINLSFFYLFILFDNKNLNYIFPYFSAKDFRNFYIFSFIFFLIGFIDDKFKIGSNIKLFLYSLLIYLLIFFSNEISLKSIDFSYFFGSVNIESISIFFTTLCFLLFINAFNMFDGINLQCGIYTIFIFIFFILNKMLVLFSLVIILSLLVFLYYNFKNKCFLGNNGTLLISFIVSYLFIKLSCTKNIIYADQIFLIMVIPGLDLFRLAIWRILKRKHPFEADKNHIHHILLSRFGLTKTLSIILSLIILPNIFSFFIGYYFFFILVSLIIYLILVYSYSIKN